MGCGREGAYVCGECERGIEVREESLHYEGVVRKLIKEIKYRGSWDMVAELVGLWEKMVKARVGRGVVTSVPMWEPKKKLRGFNQAELIARELAKRWGGEYQELLRRERETRPMYGLSKRERVGNVRGAFAMSKQHTDNGIEWGTVILVDDVRTSGATMNECARVLTRAGWKEVRQLAIAS